MGKEVVMKKDMDVKDEDVDGKELMISLGNN